MSENKITFPVKLASNNPQSFGIVDATEISGHRRVNTLSNLYAISDPILSVLKDGSDAVGQEWFVVSEDCKYRLDNWANRKSASGWTKLPKQELINTKQSVSEKDQPNGYAGLDSNGKIPIEKTYGTTATVVDVATYEKLPVAGLSGVIYYVSNTGAQYKWSGSAYIDITDGADNAKKNETSIFDCSNGTSTKYYSSLSGAINVVPPVYRTSNRIISYLSTESSPTSAVNYQFHGIDSTTWTDLTKWERIPNQADLAEIRSDLNEIPFNRIGYISRYDVFIPNKYWLTSPVFKVVPGSLIKVSQRVNIGDYYIYYYDCNFKFLPSISPTALIGTSIDNNFIVPDGVSYACLHSYNFGDVNAKLDINNIQLLSYSFGQEIDKKNEKINTDILQVVKPPKGDNWDEYSSNLTITTHLWANVQNEVVSVKGIRVPAYRPLLDSVRSIQVYYMDINDASTLQLLSNLDVTKEINDIYFNEKILIGGSKQIFLNGLGVRFKIAANDKGVYQYDMSSNTYTINKSICMGYELILSESISERIDNIAKKIDATEELIIDNEDIITGFWYRDEFKIGGSYNNLKTHQNAIKFEDCTIKFDCADSSKTVYGLSLYDSEMNPLGNYPQGARINKSIAIRTREILKFPAYSSAFYFRVNYGVIDKGAYVTFPSQYNLSVVKKKYKSTIKVDKNGNGDFSSIKDAIDNAFDNIDTPVNILIENGIYDETNKVGSDRYLCFKGSNKELVVLRSHSGQYVDAPLWIDGDFCIENITLEMLDDAAPLDWVPGDSQIDRLTMLPGYALHVDGGNGDFGALNGEYKLGVVRNCILKSVANSALGCGLHANNKVVLDNCDFIRNVAKNEYLTYSSDYGAAIVHDEIGSQDENQMIDIINCRFYSNLTSACKLDMSHSDDTSNITIKCLHNSFYAGGSDNNAITFVKNNALLHKISHGNNNLLLNA